MTASTQETAPSALVYASEDAMLSNQQVRFCAILVQRQKGTIIEVAKTADALEWAHNRMPRISIDAIKYLANIVNNDVKGFREIPLEHNSAPDEIEGHLLQLLDAWEAGRTDSRHFYWEFCAIHPFGTNVNGTVAVILYNWCNHTAGHPMFPPAYGMGGEGV